MKEADHLTGPENSSTGSGLAAQGPIDVNVDPRLIQDISCSHHTAPETTELDGAREDQCKAGLEQTTPAENAESAEIKAIHLPRDNSSSGGYSGRLSSYLSEQHLMASRTPAHGSRQT